MGKTGLTAMIEWVLTNLSTIDVQAVLANLFLWVIVPALIIGIGVLDE